MMSSFSMRGAGCPVHHNASLLTSFQPAFWRFGEKNDLFATILAPSFRFQVDLGSEPIFGFIFIRDSELEGRISSMEP